MATILDFDEINKLAEYSFNASEDIESLVNDIESILINAYVSGVDKANEDLKTNYEVEADEMFDILYLEIAGKTFDDRIREYYKADDLNGIEKVVKTESHRMVNSGINRVGEKATNDGKQVYKRWETMGDERVRDTHDYLEGMTIPFDQKFYTFDGDSALYCGGFSNAENNINCRCWIVLTS